MLFNRRRRAAWEFEVAVHYLLHDAKELVSLMKEMNADKWPGFIDDILNGARPYEEATAVSTFSCNNLLGTWIKRSVARSLRLLPATI
jgi:hypothetical protein